MPLTDDERAAMERLHRSNGRPGDVAVAVTIALREHPADEGHEIAPEWLESIGLRLETPENINHVAGWARLLPGDGDEGKVIRFICIQDSEWMFEVGRPSDWWPKGFGFGPLYTRGDVCRLLGALGIEVKG